MTLNKVHHPPHPPQKKNPKKKNQCSKIHVKVRFFFFSQITKGTSITCKRRTKYLTIAYGTNKIMSNMHKIISEHFCSQTILNELT